MKKGLREQIELVKEMEEIDRQFTMYSLEMECLRRRKEELLAEKENAEIFEVVDYALEVGVTSFELMQLVVQAHREKKKHAS